MGDEANDILWPFMLSKPDRKKYELVKAWFDAYFIKRRNIIFECAHFNMRRQEEGEPVDAFITAHYSLDKLCGYSDLHDEMIQDRIVVGTHNGPSQRNCSWTQDWLQIQLLLKCDNQKPSNNNSPCLEAEVQSRHSHGCSSESKEKAI